MHTKRQKAIRIGMITALSFISGIIVTVVAAATYDATIQNRAAKMLAAIKTNAADLTAEDAAAYYGLVSDNIKSLIAVLTEVDKGLSGLSGDTSIIPTPGTNSGSPGAPGPGSSGSSTPGTTACSGTYPKNDPNASFWPNGGFVTGPTTTDKTNKIWKYKYNGTCMFDCSTGYTYSPTSNTCEKNTYAWACGFSTGGPTAVASQCNAQTVGTHTSGNCTCELTGGPKGNPIAINPAEGVFDMAAPKTLTARFNGIAAENLLLCQEVITHPNPNVTKNPGNCQSANSYAPFPGSPGWKYNNGGYDITVPYDAAIFGAAGIKTTFFLKDKTTNQVATYTISVKNGGSSSSTNPTNPTNPTTPNITCTGPVPATNVIKTVMPASVGVGDWNNTEWKYQYGGSCSWRCEKGYVPNPAKTSCITPAPGGGTSVTVVDKNGAALAGVTLSLVYGPNSGEGSWTTNPNGFIELFPEFGYTNAVLVIEKAGYIIFSAEGCSSRSGVATNIGGQPYSYCDSTPLAPGSQVKLVLMPTPSNFQNFVFQGLTNNEGVFWINDANYHVIKTQISGIAQNDTLSCMEIIAHPNTNVAKTPGNCSNDANFTPFTGNNEWTWSPENGGTWKGEILYSDAIYGAAGIKVRVFMKNKNTNQVASFDIAVYKS